MHRVDRNSPISSSTPILRSSPRTMDPPSFPFSSTPGMGNAAPPAQPAKARGYIIRMDTHYDPDTHLLTAMLELPGVRREDLSVRLSTCSYNGVRQIRVSGVVHPPFPALGGPGGLGEGVSGVLVRERRYGPCSRVIPVPSDLKVR